MSFYPEGVHFKGGTCREHRKLFVRICIGHGILDPEDMERIRLLTICEIARTYDNHRMRRWLGEECVGCDTGGWVVSIVHRVCEREAALMEMEEAGDSAAGRAPTLSP